MTIPRSASTSTTSPSVRIQKILDAKELTGKGFRVFETDKDSIKLLE
ncbi:MAG: hypothetical protein Q7R65_02070 [bacterium]|nr:hypothetical protein [bacterium]